MATDRANRQPPTWASPWPLTTAVRYEAAVLVAAINEWL